MPEYNFWDDRTTECNDSHFCPVINDYCLQQRCDDCEMRKVMDAYYRGERAGREALEMRKGECS